MKTWNVEYKLGKIKIKSSDQDLMCEVADVVYGSNLPVDPFVTGLNDDMFVSFYYDSATPEEAVEKTTEMLKSTDVAEDFELILVEEDNEESS